MHNGKKHWIEAFRKIAGEVQPVYRDYFEAKVTPHIDGKQVEYIGLADLEAKNELLETPWPCSFRSNGMSRFGLVMVEAMACGTPVLALRAGSVPEIVKNGVSGYVSRRIDDLVLHARNLHLEPFAIRRHVEENFSKERMARDYRNLYARILGQADASSKSAA
jgi:glycosyltransferase involved in cell wall biosynthesis